jgi:hypothetical protein
MLTGLSSATHSSDLLPLSFKTGRLVARSAATSAAAQHTICQRATAASYLPPVRDFLLVQVPITLLASSAGVWLFYVQHQFEHTHWARGADWDLHTGALHGSSHYDLLPVLRWFTANIGSIIGGAVGGGDVGEIKRAPAWNARREQPRFIGLRRDWLIRDSSSGDDGERRRDLVVAARNGPGERIGLTGVRDGVAEHDRCGADVAGVNKWKTIVSHRSCKSSLSPNGVCGA